MQTLLTFRCPACGAREQALNPQALGRLRQEGLCQGCRARRSLEGKPGLLPLFVGFWRRSGFPASSSWLDAVPARPAVTLASPKAEGPSVAAVRH